MQEKHRRIVMTVFGVLITGFSVGMFNLSSFGMDPFQVFAHGIWRHIPISFGTFYMILNLLMLVVIFLIDRRKIGLGTFINIIFLGYVVQFSSSLFEAAVPHPTIVVRILFLILGIVILCFGASLYFVGDLGVSTYDAIALILSERKVARFQYCRIGTDLFCTIIGFVLGTTIGVGTLFTALFMGPIIAFFTDRVSNKLRYGKSIRSE